MSKSLSLETPFGEVTVTDAQTHWRIDADTLDAACWAQGWLHSRDLGDEALFARALFRAQLSNSAKATTAHSELDAFFRPWCFDWDLDREVAALDAGIRSQVHAYAEGFQEHQQSLRFWPWARPEFPRTPWTMEDSLLLARTLGFVSWWETRAELVFFLLDMVRAGVAWDHLRDLVPELGAEPDRTLWDDVERRVPWSPDAVALVGRLRRWRPGVAVGHPCLAASVVTDVTEPGMPFVEMVMATPEGTVRGLSLAGLPGFLTGRTATLAWHLAPSWGDIVNFRIREDRTLDCTWVGEGRTGTLQTILRLGMAHDLQTLLPEIEGLGTAALTLLATDQTGASGQWELGPRWVRPHARDAWLPSKTAPTPGSAVAEPPGPLQRWIQEQLPLPSRSRPQAVQALLASTYPLQVSTLLPHLRFLLPETEESALLRTWSGNPSTGVEAQLFERLTRAVWTAFWGTVGLNPDIEGPASGWLLPMMEKLVATPHSAWLPSGQKNELLREAVRRELLKPAPPPQAEPERRRSPRQLYRETLGGKSRIFATVVMVVADFADETLAVFHTDDETEKPVFHEL